MILSLNEIQAATKRATRGLGHSWGIAEESAKAVRWLCGRGLGGCEVLASYLRETAGADLSNMVVQDSAGNWSSQSGRLCPLLSGATLSDHAYMLRADPIRLQGVVAPVFLLAFAAAAAKEMDCVVSVKWNDVVAMTDGADLWLNCEIGALTSANPAEVLVQRVALPSGERVTRHTFAVPQESSFKTITEFAERTYAPATEESRLLGAGAGLGDND
ncbi:DUF3726 domain-containing protein [Cochlodiniinecator piscidefendens]|uniref:DUF3726 domain-containing protein n=1 Tax=Cochlodiniinecator piscidefendens TaxID=2715756 RepID=UPI00140CAC92|nr:DUF3726 domain-containing protein [Cochlodiniinecator piscidefendens]